MIFKETKLKGAFLIELEKFEDERGFFALSWSVEAFAACGLEANFVEGNISFNQKKGTLRGMHYQQSPHGQAKLVRCTRGAIYDVIVDLRPASPTLKQWVGTELTAANYRALYVPADFAHGFQTLEENSEVCYQMSSPYVPGSGREVRWNDPAMGINWPLAVSVIADRDATAPDYRL
jgi:dTDP-4-dehydrorhamnose 3,5-epimerase